MFQSNLRMKLGVRGSHVLLGQVWGGRVVAFESQVSVGGII